jgi:hypothetical protein
VTQYTSEKFTKKLLGESEIEAVLQRLDRLAQDEARYYWQMPQRTATDPAISWFLGVSENRKMSCFWAGI